MTVITEAPTLQDALDTLRPMSRNGQMLTVADARFPVADAYKVVGGEGCKSLSEVERLWAWLERRSTTRSTLLAIVGGGSVTDMAGFAAACFKRGIDTAYVPTTLLGAVDASIGGKTGINYVGLKNEIGAFHLPRAVVMVPALWQSLPSEELASGYGELLKTSLLESAHAAEEALRMGADVAADPDYIMSAKAVARCAAFKQRVTEADPHDLGIRRQLNLGHTFAHAFESYARRRDQHLSHGHAVAAGLVCMAALSNLRTGLDGKWTDRLSHIVRTLYKPFFWRCDDADEIIDYMRHDKKNSTSETISCVLLSEPGSPVNDCPVTPDEVRAALEIATDYLHL